jgi:hypothetical protein
MKRPVNGVEVSPVLAGVMPRRDAAYFAEATGREATNAAFEARHSANT